MENSIVRLQQESALGSVVFRTKRYAERMIVLDDGSSDQTAEAARLVGAGVIRHPVNQGKRTAL